MVSYNNVYEKAGFFKKDFKYRQIHFGLFFCRIFHDRINYFECVYLVKEYLSFPFLDIDE